MVRIDRNGCRCLVQRHGVQRGALVVGVFSGSNVELACPTDQGVLPLGLLTGEESERIEQCRSATAAGQFPVGIRLVADLVRHAEGGADDAAGEAEVGVLRRVNVLERGGRGTGIVQAEAAKDFLGTPCT